MKGVIGRDDEFTVDAGLLAEGLGLDPATVLTAMREKKITSRFERGVDGDAGRNRLTFFHGSRRFRLTIDEDGKILERSVGYERRG